MYPCYQFAFACTAIKYYNFSLTFDLNIFLMSIVYYFFSSGILKIYLDLKIHHGFNIHVENIHSLFMDKYIRLRSIKSYQWLYTYKCKLSKYFVVNYMLNVILFIFCSPVYFMHDCYH